jgi:hypothetical protein
LCTYRLDSGYALKPKNSASAACGYLQGITVDFLAVNVFLKRQLYSCLARLSSRTLFYKMCLIKTNFCLFATIFICLPIFVCLPNKKIQKSILG